VVWLAVALPLLLACGPAAAGAAMLIVPIPGVAGPSVQSVAALRTSDGGAILLARIAAGPRASNGTTLTARIDAAGALDLGYGYEGVTGPLFGAAVRPTALAIDPATGDAWIGASNGRHSEILAIGAAGQPVASFGDGGVVRLTGSDDGGVPALAWRAGELAVSAGAAGRCHGCLLTLLDATDGARLATTALNSTAIGGGTCAGPAGVTSVAFARGGRLLVATEGARDCTASLLLAPFGAPGAIPPPLPAEPLQAVIVTPEPGATCVAGVSPAGVGIWPLGGAGPTPVAAPPATRLITIVPLGSGACGALLSRGRLRPAEVMQTSSADPAPAITQLPAGVTPLAMFRCHQHLLVIGASASGATEAAVIVPVPISGGPFAATFVAAAGASATRTTGCG
jgi:hypothetical protein